MFYIQVEAKLVCKFDTLTPLCVFDFDTVALGGLDSKVWFVRHQVAFVLGFDRLDSSELR